MEFFLVMAAGLSLVFGAGSPPSMRIDSCPENTEPRCVNAKKYENELPVGTPILTPWGLGNYEGKGLYSGGNFGPKNCEGGGGFNCMMTFGCFYFKGIIGKSLTKVNEPKNGKKPTKSRVLYSIAQNNDFLGVACMPKKAETGAPWNKCVAGKKLADFLADESSGIELFFKSGPSRKSKDWWVDFYNDKDKAYVKNPEIEDCDYYMKMADQEIEKRVPNVKKNEDGSVKGTYEEHFTLFYKKRKKPVVTSLSVETSHVPEVQPISVENGTKVVSVSNVQPTKIKEVKSNRPNNRGNEAPTQPITVED